MTSKRRPSARRTKIDPTADVEPHWLDEKWSDDRDAIPSFVIDRPISVDRYRPSRDELDRMLKDYENDN